MRAAHFKFFMGPYTTIVNKREQISKLTGSRQAPRCQLPSCLSFCLPSSNLQRSTAKISPYVASCRWAVVWLKMKKLKTTTTNFAHVKREKKREREGERAKEKGGGRQEDSKRGKQSYEGCTKYWANINIKQRFLNMKLSCAIKANLT